MPTNKTPFTFNIEDEYLEKMRYIAKRETRSLSNLLEHLCKLHIERYELCLSNENVSKRAPKK